MDSRLVLEYHKALFPEQHKLLSLLLFEVPLLLLLFRTALLIAQLLGCRVCMVVGKLADPVYMVGDTL